MPLVGVIVYADGRYPFNAPAAAEPGDVILRPDGTLAVLDGFENVELGERIAPEPIRACKVIEVAAASGDTWPAGTVLYYDAANKRATPTRGANRLIGLAPFAKTSGQTRVLVNCVPDVHAGPINIRSRFTTAQVNAGATIVPAEPGVRYRLIDASIIAIGGAAGAVTTVNIAGTQSASAVNLVAFAQASLLQSALLRAGGSGATILANGASFVANDANTALTIGKSGSDVTTATHFDVNLTYAREI